MRSLIAAASAHDSGADPVAILGAVALILGLLAAVHQLAGIFTRRRYKRAKQRALELIRQSLDADELQHELRKTKAERDALRRQVDEDLPREARRVYVATRLEQLSEQMRADAREFNELHTELTELGGSTNGAVDQRLRGAIGTGVIAAAPATPSIDRILLGGVAILTLVLVSSKTSLEGFYSDIAYSSGRAAADVTVSIVLGALFVCLVALLIARYVLPSLHGHDPWPWLWSSVIALGIAATLLIIRGSVESNRGTALFFADASSSRVERQMDREAQRHQESAGFLYAVGMPAAGLFVALLLCCVQLQGAAAGSVGGGAGRRTAV